MRLIATDPRKVVRDCSVHARMGLPLRISDAEFCQFEAAIKLKGDVLKKGKSLKGMMRLSTAAECVGERRETRQCYSAGCP